MRVFDSWSLRSPSLWKMEYFWFMHPLLDLSYARYMDWHRLMENWELRDSNNWWLWWSTDVSLQSMVRHVEDLKALHAWYRVFKVRWVNWERTYYVHDQSKFPVYEWEVVEEVNKEMCLNAIRFNTQAYLLEELNHEE